MKNPPVLNSPVYRDFLVASGRQFLLLTTLGAMLLGTNLTAAVITDPTLTTSTPVDPVGSREVTTGTGGAAVSKATLNSGSSVYGLQGWAGFTSGTASTNIVNFTSASLPDLRFTFSGSNVASTTGGPNTSTSQVTSGSSGLNITSGNATAGNIVLTIDFGSYNVGSSLFTTGTNGVDLAAFTVANVRGSVNFAATFYNSVGSILYASGTQSGTNTDGGDTQNGANFLFSYQSDGTAANAISQIVLTRTWTNNGSSAQGLDDFAFSAIPEPGTASSLGLAASLLFAVQWYRRRGSSLKN